MTRDRILITVAVVCGAAAVLLVLLARDVGRWQTAMRAGDVAASPAGVPRQADETLPFSPARSLLGLDDDVAYRRAAALFVRAKGQDEEVGRTSEGATARIRAEAALAEAIRTEHDRARASAASTLLGVLAFIDAANAPNAGVERSVLAFQDALRLDRSNADAKTNLELLFQTVASTSSVRGRERLQRSAHAGASASESGHGY